MNKLTTKRERHLVIRAECSRSDEEANKAMKALREEFDPTYMWCQDCDGLVVTKKNCCMNRNPGDDKAAF